MFPDKLIISHLKHFLSSYILLSRQLQDTGKRCSGGQLFYERCTTRWSIIRLAFTAARHSFCTQLIKSGVDPKTVALLTGHSSVDVIYNWYVSSSSEDKQRAVDGLQI
ncbi:tyrosine-type recombinase/integrase [Brevibacillus sp. NSP2.1]|nr:tyrosine-type recombinase/integrase [Brevibacillus sp. NSP2.1]